MKQGSKIKALKQSNYSFLNATFGWCKVKDIWGHKLNPKNTRCRIMVHSRGSQDNWGLKGLLLYWKNAEVFLHGHSESLSFQLPPGICCHPTTYSCEEAHILFGVPLSFIVFIVEVHFRGKRIGPIYRHRTMWSKFCQGFATLRGVGRTWSRILLSF